MRKIIHLSAIGGAARPPAADRLGTAESVLLLALRWWVSDHRNNLDPLPRLCAAMRIAGAHDAAFSVDQLMAVVARTARHPIAIHCPRCPNLSEDENCLLGAATLTQAGAGTLAKQVLHAALLSADGALFALGPLEGLCALFRLAHLDFGRRPASANDPLEDDGARLSAQDRTLH
jgi:hypothetical protein